MKEEAIALSAVLQQTEKKQKEEQKEEIAPQPLSFVQKVRRFISGGFGSSGFKMS